MGQTPSAPAHARLYFELRVGGANWDSCGASVDPGRLAGTDPIKFSQAAVFQSSMLTEIYLLPDISEPTLPFDLSKNRLDAGHIVGSQQYEAMLPSGGNDPHVINIDSKGYQMCVS